MPQAKRAYITPSRFTPALPREIPEATRRLVEGAIEAHIAAQAALIAFLDEADGDPDLEPSLGYFLHGRTLAALDLEEQCEDEGVAEGL